MNDHQDSENFAYDKMWDDIEVMLDKAERKQNWCWMKIQRATDKKERIKYMRTYKGLQGVINALRWVLGDIRMTSDEVLGDN